MKDMPPTPGRKTKLETIRYLHKPVDKQPKGY